MILAVAITVDEDFRLELSKKQQQHYQEQLSTSDTESSEHEAPGKIVYILVHLTWLSEKLFLPVFASFTSSFSFFFKPL